VSVDLDVAFRAHGEIDRAVARNLIEHVRKEGQGGSNAALTRAVQVDLDQNVGLARPSLDQCLATHLISSGWKAPAALLEVFDLPAAVLAHELERAARTECERRSFSQHFETGGR